MTKCPNCQSEKGTKKDNIWKCKVCNGEHKINLKTDTPEESHAGTATASTPATTRHGQVSPEPESAPSQHEAPKRATVGNSRTDTK